MSYREVKYDKTVSFIGRNGLGKCKGIDVSKCHKDYLTLSPIRSIGGTGNCQIEIPLENIDDLVRALFDMKFADVG
jgi:hypothetical protein